MDQQVTFSTHAIERCAARGIDEIDIYDVLKNPDHIVQETSCKHIYQKLISENNNRMLLRVFVNICKEPTIVITAYKTSKLDKYEY